MSPADRRRRRGRGMLVLAAVVLVLAVLASFAVGPLRLPPVEVLQALGVKLGLVDPQAVSSRDLAVVWQLRIPRALLGAMVGAALAMAGASLQGLFGNPLADPGIVGVSQGAALGAVAAIVLGAAGAAGWIVPVAAFVGGAVAISLTYLLARPGKGSGNATLLLVGIAMAAFCSALIGFLTYIASESELQSLVFWQMGSLARASWSDVVAVLPLFAIGVFALQRLSTPLDMLALANARPSIWAWTWPVRGVGWWPSVRCWWGPLWRLPVRWRSWVWWCRTWRACWLARATAGCCRCRACWARC